MRMERLTTGDFISAPPKPLDGGGAGYVSIAETGPRLGAPRTILILSGPLGSWATHQKQAPR
jgi:hypothetical protein